MTWIKVLLWLIPRRLRSTWLLLAVASFGILAAVTLMAVGAVYSRALAEGGLRHTLASTSQINLNAHVGVDNRPLGLADYERLRPIVEDATETRIGHMVLDMQRLGRTRPNLTMVDALDGLPPPPEAPRGQPFFLTDFQEHARLIEGEWPRAAPVLHDKGVDIEVVLAHREATVAGIAVGSRMYLLPFRQDPSEGIGITVSGLAEPIDPSVEYWMGLSATYFRVSPVDIGESELVPMYVTEETFFGGIGARYPFLVGNYGWFFYLDTGVLTASNAKPTKEAIIGLESDLNKHAPRSVVFSGLENTISDYERDLNHARVPLFIFISMVVAVILYFLAVVMGLLARTRSDEASLLRSRGASVLQVGGVLALAEGAVALVSMIVGPFLALGIVRYLLLRTINPAGEGGALSVGVSADMFVMGAIGGLLSLGVLVASGMGLARLGMVEFLRVRARPPTVPLLHRYYVDLLVLAAVGLLWWQIKSRGGFIGRDVLGQQLEIDPNLLFVPVLLLLAAAFLMLRLLPLLMKALAWAGNYLGPAWVSFALVRMARDPLPHGSLAIILMMAAALGFFGATFQSTLSRSQRDQALYRVGGDLVLKGFFLPSATQELVENIPGIRAASLIGRDPVILMDGYPGFTADLLYIDPDTLPDTLWFRDDFADKSLTELLAPLQRNQDKSPGVVLPAAAERIGIWVNADQSNQGRYRQTLVLWVRVSDAEGRYRRLLLGDILPSRSSSGGASQQGWTYFETSLPVNDPILEPPFSVVSVSITSFSAGSAVTRTQPGSIDLDDITIKGPFTSAAGRIVEGYEDPGASSNMWIAMPNATSEEDTVKLTSQAARSSRFGLRFSWQASVGITSRGIFIPPVALPLPAIAGPGFHVGQELRVTSTREVVPLVVRGVTDYFPTLYPSRRFFFLVPKEDYTEYIRSVPDASLGQPREFWVSPEDTADRRQVIRTFREQVAGLVTSRDRDAEVSLAQRKPLAGGGWNGLTILSMSAITVAVVLALSTFAAVSIQMGRVDLTVVRALGLSRLQLLLSLALERVIVATLGIAAGSAIGIWLGRWVLGKLDITTGGQDVIPPMLVTVHDGLMALVLVELVLAVVAAVIFAAVSARRLRTADILRVG